jgi:hypothetical protein
MFTTYDFTANAPYKDYGGRKGYLKMLATDYGIEFSDVWEIAELLGPEEDFDGLVSTLDDIYPIDNDYNEEDEDQTESYQTMQDYLDDCENEE